MYIISNKACESVILYLKCLNTLEVDLEYKESALLVLLLCRLYEGEILLRSVTLIYLLIICILFIIIILSVSCVHTSHTHTKHSPLLCNHVEVSPFFSCSFHLTAVQKYSRRTLVFLVNARKRCSSTMFPRTGNISHACCSPIANCKLNVITVLCCFNVHFLDSQAAEC